MIVGCEQRVDDGHVLEWMGREEFGQKEAIRPSGCAQKPTEEMERIWDVSHLRSSSFSLCPPSTKGGGKRSACPNRRVLCLLTQTDTAVCAKQAPVIYATGWIEGAAHKGPPPAPPTLSFIIPPLTEAPVSLSLAHSAIESINNGPIKVAHTSHSLCPFPPSASSVFCFCAARKRAIWDPKKKFCFSNKNRWIPADAHLKFLT